MDDKPYRIKVSVRNNKLLSAIENAGYESVAAFSRAVNIQETSVNSLVCMRQRPLNKRGEFSASAKALMEALGAAPTDLWTEEQLTIKLKSNTGERAVGANVIEHLLSFNEEMMTLPSPEDVFFEAEKTKVVDEILSNFNDREQKIVRMRVYQDMSFEDCADEIGISSGLVRHIYSRVLKKMGTGKIKNRIIDAGLIEEGKA